MRIQTRQVVRYHVLELQGETLQMARIGTTLASDISLSGLFLSHTKLEPGLRVHFYFELPDGYLEAVGKVVHNQHRIDGAGVTRPGSGVRFIRMSLGDRVRLEAFLDGRRPAHRFPESRGQMTLAAGG
jgi:hypothetical protein